MSGGNSGISAGPVRLEAVSKSLGGTEVLHGIDLHVGQGEFVSLIGPSGSGKTTTLRILAGLEVPGDGRVLLGDTDLTLVPPHLRGFSMVFQHFALFPHKDVFHNVAYGLQVRGLGKAEIEQRVMSMLERVEMTQYASNKVNELSGGQRQRVAIARALVTEPALILLDEPTGSLDAKLRLQMQSVLKSLHRELGLTFVHVTHNQSEALALADRVYVMYQGRIEQVGTPSEVYNYPQTRFVADFVGQNNLIDGAIEDGAFVSDLGSMPVAKASMGNGNEIAGRCTAVIRADALRPGVAGDGSVTASARIEALDYHGSSVTWFLRVGDLSLSADVSMDETNRLAPELGHQCRISWNPSDVHFVVE